MPALGWLRHYRRAGLPPQAGLFAAFAGLLGYGLFEMLSRSGLADQIGQDHLHRDVEAAITDASA